VRFSRKHKAKCTCGGDAQRERERERERETDGHTERLGRTATWNTKAGERKGDITREKELTVATRGLCGEINMAIPAAAFADTADTRQHGEEINKET